MQTNSTSEGPATLALRPAGRSTDWKQLFNVFFASFGFVALRFLLGPIRIKVLTNLLTKDQYGTLTLIGLTVAFLTLVSSLGSLEFLLRRIPGRSVEYQNRLFKTILLSFGGLSVVLALVGTGWLVSRPPAKISLSGSAILACGLLLVLTMHLNQYSYFLLGLSKYALSRIALLLQGDTWFLPLLVFFWVGAIQIDRVLWIWVAWLMLTVLVMQRWIRFPRVWSTHPSCHDLAEVLRFGLPLVPLILGEWMFQVQDRYVLLHCRDIEAVAHYNLGMGVALVGVLVGSAVLDILLVEFFKIRNRIEGRTLAELSANPELRHHFTNMVRYALLVGIPFGLALSQLGVSVIRVLASERFLPATVILAWLSPLPVVYFLFVIFGRMLMGVSQNARLGAATLAGALFHLLLNMALVPALGERGAALAAVAGYAVLAVYLGARVRAWRWLIGRDLQPVRLLLLLALCGIGYAACARLLARFGGWMVLVAAAAWTVLAIALLGLMKKADLQLFLDTFVRDGAPQREPG